VAYKRDEVGVLVRQDTEESRKLASERVLAAFREVSGRQKDACYVLNVAESTLIRWVKRLKLQAAIALIQQRAKNRGEYVRGRPKKRLGWKRKAGM